MNFKRWIEFLALALGECNPLERRIYAKVVGRNFQSSWLCRKMLNRPSHSYPTTALASLMSWACSKILMRHNGRDVGDCEAGCTLCYSCERQWRCYSCERQWRLPSSKIWTNVGLDVKCIGESRGGTRLRKTMGFYTMERDLEGDSLYENREINDVILWSDRNVWAYQNWSYRQADSSPDCDSVKNECKRATFTDIDDLRSLQLAQTISFHHSWKVWLKPTSLIKEWLRCNHTLRMCTLEWLGKGNLFCRKPLIAPPNRHTGPDFGCPPTCTSCTTTSISLLVMTFACQPLGYFVTLRFDSEFLLNCVMYHVRTRWE